MEESEVKVEKSLFEKLMEEEEERKEREKQILDEIITEEIIRYYAPKWKKNLSRCGLEIANQLSVRNQEIRIQDDVWWSIRNMVYNRLSSYRLLGKKVNLFRLIRQTIRQTRFE